MILRLVTFSFLFIGSHCKSQQIIVGQVLDKMTKNPISQANVRFINTTISTDKEGKFYLNIEIDKSGLLEITANEYLNFSKFLDPSLYADPSGFNIGLIELEKGIDILSFDLQEIQESADQDQIPSGNLNAYQDPFSNLAAFEFRQVNFRRRGFDSDYQNININGLKVNDLELNRPIWSWWGGLNDAFRNQVNGIGIEYSETMPSSIGGFTNFSIRPSKRANKLQNSLSLTNYSYMTRAMSSYSSGLGDKGWSWLFNSSYRFGDDTFFDGVFYNSVAMLGSVEKTFSNSYSLVFTGFYSPTNRSGRTSISQEEADLAPSGEQYNPYWGLQNGDVRFSRVQRSRQPFFMLSNYITLTDKIKINANLAYRFGSFGRTRLEYYNQNDPEPNNPRYLPSSFDRGSLEYEAAKNAFSNDINYNQINWDELYATNLNSLATVVPNANGLGNNVIGQRSNYMLQEEISDDQQISSNILLNYNSNPSSSYQFGTYLSTLNRDYYKEVDDLLGGDFWVDIDRFLEFDFEPYSDETQNDLQNPNRLVKEGDRFGYYYTITSSQWNVFVQNKKKSYPIEYNWGLSIGNTSFLRNGYYQKGAFPEESMGKSDKLSFLEFQSNVGLTYYLDGKKSFLINGILLQNAPRGEWVFPQARSNNNTLPNIESENIFGGDLNFRLSEPKFKLISSFYYYRKFNSTERNLSLLNLDNDSNLFDVDFLSVTLQNVQQQFMGIELGVTYDWTPRISLNGGFTIAEHEYKNNPTIYVANDDILGINKSIMLLNGQKSFLKGLDVGLSPQYVFALGIAYRSPKFWYTRLSANHFSRSYIQPNALNRTQAILNDRITNNPTLTAEELIRQKEFEQGLSVNFSLGKSWRLKRSLYLRLSTFVNNIFDNSMQSWGFEQTNYKRTYGYFNRYSFTQGRTFFINLKLGR